MKALISTHWPWPTSRPSSFLCNRIRFMSINTRINYHWKALLGDLQLDLVRDQNLVNSCKMTVGFLWCDIIVWYCKDRVHFKVTSHMCKGRVKRDMFWYVTWIWPNGARAEMFSMQPDVNGIVWMQHCKDKHEEIPFSFDSHAAPKKLTNQMTTSNDLIFFRLPFCL